MRSCDLVASSRVGPGVSHQSLRPSRALGNAVRSVKVQHVPRALADDASTAYQSLLDQATGTFNAVAGSLPSAPALPGLPEPLEKLAQQQEWAQNLPTHWGSRQALAALESVRQQIPLQQVSEQGAGLLNSAATSLQPPPLPAGLAAAASSATSALSSATSAVTSVQSAAADAAARTAAAAADLSASATLAATGSAPGSLQSHFGVRSVERAVTALSDWALTSLSWLELPQPGSLDDLKRSLADLQQATLLVGTMPSLSGPPSGLSLEAAQAAISAVLQQQGAAMASAASGAVPAGALQDLIKQLPAALEAMQANGIGGHNLALLAVVVPAVMAAVAAAAPSSDYDGYTSLLPYDDHVKLGHHYSAEEVEEYFRRRPMAVARRAAQVAAEAAGFGAALMLDIWTGRLQANEAERAVQLRGVIERLGPAYVKVAQALSTRVDLLTPQYFEQIQLLQDRVPPFPCSLAMAAMEEAFGRPPSAVFATVLDKPVAAASLGQVYRATLKPELGGTEVAVKVLRPGVLEQVALDLHLMRKAAVLINENGTMNTDWAAVIDEWALRFFAEMDYDREARNAILLKQQMAHLSGISIADVVPELSTADVMTTVWVDGEKLSESRASDVRELCNTLLNAYLIQLLETGFLHADPHPGNLIRTPEGKICILDYGLMTEVTEDQRWALLEYIAHLSTEDWEALAQDLQVMGFIPAEINPKEAGLVEPLGAIMIQLVGGGGAAKVNIDKVTDELNELGKRYPFQIPPFFALILRAFSVIEGIALKVDPDYAIVKECFPYLSRRLLQDDSDRAKAVLRDVLYGNKQRLDIERLSRVASGFGAFTTDGLKADQQGSGAAAPGMALARSGAMTQAAAASTSGRGSAEAADGPALDPVLRDALVIMLGRRGSYVQELLVDEAVAAVDALSRGTLYAVLQALLGSAPAAAAARGVAALGPLRGLVLPVPTPLELLSRLTPTLATTPEDQEALAVVRGVAMLLQKMPQAQVSEASLGRAASELGPLLPELAPGLTYMTETFVKAFTKRVMQRLAGGWTMRLDDLDTTMAAVGFMPTTKPSSQQNPIGVLRQMKVPSSSSKK